MKSGSKALLIAWVIVGMPIIAAILLTFWENGAPRASLLEWLFAVACLLVVAFFVWIGERHVDARRRA